MKYKAEHQNGCIVAAMLGLLVVATPSEASNGAARLVVTPNYSQCATGHAEGFVPLVVSAIGASLVEQGVQGAGRALRAASGVDDRSHPVSVVHPGHLYQMAGANIVLAPDVGCFTVSAPEVGFSGLVKGTLSPDRSAIHFTLTNVQYPGPLWSGRRRVQGAVLGLTLRGLDGAAFGSVIFPGTLRHGQENPEAVSGWVPLPALSQAAQQDVASFQAMCASRNAARVRFVQRGGNASLFTGDCSVDLAPAFVRSLRSGDGWSDAQETELKRQRTVLLRPFANPFNLEVTLTETTDINRFLLALSNAITASEDEITKAIGDRILPTRLEAADAREASDREGFDSLRAAFNRQEQAWRNAVDREREAELALQQAESAGRPGEEVVAKRVALAAARLAREDAYKVALDARNAARAAARTAGITLPYTDPLMVFGS